MRKTLWLSITKEVLGVLVMFVILFLILNPPCTDARHKARQSTCAASMKQLWAAFSLYADDHSGKLPPASKWSDAVNPYTNYNSDAFYCPEAKPGTCAASFIDTLDQKAMKKIPNPNTTPMLFESDGGWNSALPITQAVPRHYGGYNCCYVDGHLKLIKLPQR